MTRSLRTSWICIVAISLFFSSQALGGEINIPYGKNMKAGSPFENSDLGVPVPKGVSYHVSVSGSANGTGTQLDPVSFIQQAVDIAIFGDTVVVGPGIYYENIVVDGKDIDIVGSPQDPSLTIIDGGGQGSVISFINVESDEVV